MDEAPTRTIDLKGLLCPMPVIKVSRELRELRIGETLEAYATDPAIASDIPAWCRSTSNELVTFENLGGMFRFIVRRMK